jgi:hypothetical protein
VFNDHGYPNDRISGIIDSKLRSDQLRFSFFNLSLCVLYQKALAFCRLFAFLFFHRPFLIEQVVRVTAKKATSLLPHQPISSALLSSGSARSACIHQLLYTPVIYTHKPSNPNPQLPPPDSRSSQASSPSASQHRAQSARTEPARPSPRSAA